MNDSIYSPEVRKERAETLRNARKHATGNRKEIEASKFAECFTCCRNFDVNEIEQWKDEWDGPEKTNRVQRWTALCPKCASPTVIGNASGLLRDQAYAVIVNHIAREAEGRA